jgi:ATP-binding cassette subfamily F protein 3
VLALEHITQSYGDRDLFDDVSHTVGAHDRIGLVGSNGSGKSTLLKIIAGLNEPTSGRVSRAHYVTVGYLPQDGVIASGKSLAEEAETAFEDVIEVQEEMEEARLSLETLDPADPEYTDVLEVMGELQHKLEDLDAFRMRSKVERVLMGLGFSVDDFDRDCDEFSGGWQMRIALAKLLLREPSLLLLDEPTNHLDLDSLRWFEEYLRAYNGAVILVSHDRAFLDNLTKKTLALSLGRLSVYAGNFTYYEVEREARKAQAANTLRNQQKQVEQTEKFIERFRYKATKARQVQSRIKALEKVEFTEVEGEEEEIAFHFPRPDPSGAVVMELRNISKRYGPLVVFDGLDCRIERGERIAIVGPNGAGKSTFVRILAGLEPPDSGERVPGHNAVLSYFGQHQAEELDLSKSALATVEETAAGPVRTKLRTILGSFLFHGDDVFKKVSVLSGGEKSRLALAKMLLRTANLLIMDEPTNHLDMRSKGVLLNALLEYEGTLVIVSHDRAFLDPLVTKVLEFTPGRMRTFLGTVSEYISKKQDEEKRSKGAREPGVRAGAAASGGASSGRGGPGETAMVKPPVGGHPAGGQAVAPLTEKERKRAEAEHRQKLSRELKPWKERLAAAEKEIALLETRVAELEKKLAEPDSYRHAVEAKEMTLEYQSAKPRLERAYSEWGLCTAAIEKIHAANPAPTVR